MSTANYRHFHELRDIATGNYEPKKGQNMQFPNFDVVTEVTKANVTTPVNLANNYSLKLIRLLFQLHKYVRLYPPGCNAGRHIKVNKRFGRT
jgi:hypothetical protein